MRAAPVDDTPPHVRGRIADARPFDVELDERVLHDVAGDLDPTGHQRRETDQRLELA